MNDRLLRIASRFALGAPAVEVRPLGNGLINDTYRIVTEGDSPDYVLQRINHDIFRDVDMLQDNIRRITEHIRRRLAAEGAADLERCTLTPVSTADGRTYLLEEGEYWRVTRFIDRSVSCEQVDRRTARSTGEAFGRYQELLSDLEGGPLGETIPDFHNTEFRVRQLREAAAADTAGRLAEVRPVVDELLDRAEEMCAAQRLHREGLLPKRITHCDTKVNNMLFDRDSGELLCVIDLDTTMPGFVLSDFGDFIRTAANTGAEDEADLSRIDVDMDIFRAFAEGYVGAARGFLTRREIELLPYGAQMMTYMQTVRFLTDYLNGDTYYKILFNKHNLQRTYAQLTMLHRIDDCKEDMEKYISTLLQ